MYSGKRKFQEDGGNEELQSVVICSFLATEGPVTTGGQAYSVPVVASTGYLFCFIC